MPVTRFDLAAFDAVDQGRVAELLQRISDECSAAGLSCAVDIELCAKLVRRQTGEPENRFRQSRPDVCGPHTYIKQLASDVYEIGTVSQGVAHSSFHALASARTWDSARATERIFAGRFA